MCPCLEWSGLKVRRSCSGMMNYGNFNDDKESFNILDTALEAGVNIFGYFVQGRWGGYEYSKRR